MRHARSVRLSHDHDVLLLHLGALGPLPFIVYVHVRFWVQVCDIGGVTVVWTMNDHSSRVLSQCL